MRLRIKWVRCPDCGRHGKDGGCFIVERRGLLGWRPFIVTYDRMGDAFPQHFRSDLDAQVAVHSMCEPPPADERVVHEWSQ